MAHKVSDKCFIIVNKVLLGYALKLSINKNIC